MILRRVIAHFKKQEWTAIFLDFLIVVVGVFVGLRVNNWNEARAFDARERDFLVELRSDIEKGVSDTKQRQQFYAGVSQAGAGTLKFLDEDRPCEDDCWRLLVAFFHASQWIDVSVSRSTFDEMRRLGLPRSREVTAAVEDYYAQNVSISSILNERPVYRVLVRSLIPVDAQQALWTGCHTASNGIERMTADCPAGVPDALARETIEAIRAEPNIRRTLTLWTSVGGPTTRYLEDQNAIGEKAIAAIDATLGEKP